MPPVFPDDRNDPELPSGARERLLARVQRSVEQHRGFVTVRREQFAWSVPCDGISACTLFRGVVGPVQLLRLDAGAELPWDEGILAQELLVLDGRLGWTGADGVGQTLERHGFLIRERDGAPALRALGATRVYLRERVAPLEALPPLEARWWRLAQGRPRVVRPGQRRWAPNAPGVSVLPLWGDAEIVSMLVRFEAGASVADHHHAVDEDCLVLEGEMFLGDILLRADDYQLAPAGGGHWGETSDVGVLFFFHGAIDPVLNRA